MGKIIKFIVMWVRLLPLAFYKIEKNILSQKQNFLSDGYNQEQSIKQNMLADDLIQGRITEEVTLLRSRLYKVIEATDELKNAAKPILNDKGEITGYNIDESPKKKTFNKKIKGDPFNEGRILMVINNATITSSVLDSFESIGGYGIKQDKPIIVNRDIRPRFEIEKYTTKLFVREIKNSDNKMLEFYIPNYPDFYDRKTFLLISNIKKAQAQPKNSDFLDIKSVGFITNNDVGIRDFLEFQYLIEDYYGIFEYGGNLIVKFIGKPMIENECVVEKYRNDKLEEKYNNKEFKGKL